MNELKYLLKEITNHRCAFINQWLCLFVESIIEVLFPLMLGIIVDESFVNNNFSFFRVGILIYLLLFTLKFFLFLYHSFNWQYLINSYVLDIRKSLLKTFLKSKISFLEKSKSGEVIELIEGTSDDFMHIIQRSFFHLVNSAMTFLFSSIIVIRISILIGTIFVLFIPLIVLISRHLSIKAKTASGVMIIYKMELVSWIFDLFRGLRDIRLNRAEGWFKSGFIARQKTGIRIKIRLDKIDLFLDRCSGAIVLLTTLLFYAISSDSVFYGMITVGMYLALAEYFRLMNESVKRFILYFIDLKKRIVSIGKVKKFLDIEMEEYSNEIADECRIKPMKIDSINFCSVGFGYSVKKSVLANVSFRAEKGQRVAIVARSGEGKSTLMKLLLKFYKPDTGKILINGSDLELIPTDFIRRSISVLSQDYVLFKGTIRYNITFGENITDFDLDRVCKQAQIFEFINSLPLKYETMIDVNGDGISGGQKQRLVLARTLLKNAECLVFDEMTSAVDQKTELEIDKVLSKIQGKIIFIIAHKITTIRNCDKILVLNNGSIVSEGSHEELIDKCEIYNSLFGHSILEAEIT